MNLLVKKLFKNIFANQLGFLVSVVVIFFLSPFVVNSLGGTRYGIWSLIVSLTGNYGLLAFGIQGAMTRYIAHAAATNDRERVNGYFNTALLFLLGSATLAIIVGLLASMFIDNIFVLPKDLVKEAQAACVLVTFSAAATFAFAAFDSLLVAHQRFQLTNAVGTVTTLIRAGMTVWILKQGSGIVELAALGTGLTLFNGILVAYIAKRVCPYLRISLALVRQSCFKELIDYGYKSFIVAISVTLIYQCDLFVVGIYLTPYNVTIYSLASTLIVYFIQFISSIVRTFSPFTTELYSLGKIDELRSFFVNSSSIMSMFGGFILAGCLVFGEAFYKLWVGSQYISSSVVLSILSIAFFVDTSTRVGSSILSSMAKIGPLAIATIVEGIANVILSVIFVQHYGCIGVAIGTLIPNLFVKGVWLPIHVLNILNLSGSTFLFKVVIPGMLITILGYAIGHGLTNYITIISWATFIIDTLLFTSIVLFLLYGIYKTNNINIDI